VIAAPSTSQLKRRALRATHELTGQREMGPLYKALHDKVQTYLGPAAGMSWRERWDRIEGAELELLVDCLEERIAMMRYA
jgi:hypothetical protein